MTHDAKENVPRTLITAGVKGHAEQGIGSVRASRKGMKHGLCPWAAGSRHQLLYGTTSYGGDTTGSNCLANIPGCGVVLELTQGTGRRTSCTPSLGQPRVVFQRSADS